MGEKGRAKGWRKGGVIWAGENWRERGTVGRKKGGLRYGGKRVGKKGGGIILGEMVRDKGGEK